MFGTAIKMPLGISTSHIEVPGLSPCSAPDTNFLPMCTLGGSSLRACQMQLLNYLGEKNQNGNIYPLYSHTSAKNRKYIMEVTQSHKIHDKKNHRLILLLLLAEKFFLKGLRHCKMLENPKILNKQIVLAFLFQAITFNDCTEIIFNGDFYRKTITGNKRNLLAINMTYLVAQVGDDI